MTNVASEPMSPRPDPERDLVVLLARALRLAGQAGRPDEANRLAGKVWWALRDIDPKGAERISGVMHYLAKLPEAGAAAALNTTDSQESNHG